MDAPEDRRYSRTPELENLLTLCRALNEESVRYCLYEVVRVADEFVVDLMSHACGIRFEQVAEEGLERRRVEDVEIPVASKEILIRTKDTIRESDAADVRYLSALIEEERDLRQ